LRVILYVSITSLTIFLTTNNVTAQIRISGEISGVLEDSTYIVEDSIYVTRNDSLIIEPGCELLFETDLSFFVFGKLLAVGTETDSIVFRAAPESEGWGGIFFEDDWNSRLEYCMVTGSRIGAINCMQSSSPTIRHCLITDNSNLNHPFGCGGIFINNDLSMLVEFCNITSNNGSGIFALGNANVEISNCIITHNQNSGISARGSISMSHCIIANNTDETGNGGGIALFETSQVNHCLVVNNSAVGHGGGILVGDGIPIIRNCTVIGNSAGGEGGGIHARLPGPVIINTIVSNNVNGGIYYFDHEYSYTSFCNIFDNEGGNLIGHYPDSLGRIDTVNANGDSCDAYFNIFLNTQFEDLENENYHLLSNSPCINAGNPDSPYDPDSTIADIGAYYRSRFDWVDDLLSKLKPSEFKISEIYPNPFNSELKITVSMPYSANLHVSVYNIIGQKVADLANGVYNAGNNEFLMHSNGLSSGIYILNVETSNGIRLSDRLVLVR